MAQALPDTREHSSVPAQLQENNGIPENQRRESISTKTVWTRKSKLSWQYSRDQMAARIMANYGNEDNDNLHPSSATAQRDLDQPGMFVPFGQFGLNGLFLDHTDGIGMSKSRMPPSSGSSELTSRCHHRPYSDEFFTAACHHGNYDLIEEVLRVEPAKAREARSIYGNAGAIHAAAMGGHPEIAQLLLRYGASIEEPTIFMGLTPLHLAIKYRHTSMVRFLLASGAQVYAKDRRGRQPGHMAAKLEETEIMALLIDKDGGVLKCIDHSSRQTMTYAIDGAGGLVMVRLLLAHGANFQGACIGYSHEEPEQVSTIATRRHQLPRRVVLI